MFVSELIFFPYFISNEGEKMFSWKEYVKKLIYGLKMI